ncbi:uncharacterized protein LY79DRAFT_584479 [Colletotrichum navitas]|uniref:Uncharacterized protein n=1 Tax=Colletotrichum navitas TaxID=681940 RepID=A0AAD8PLD1_9PEZI|nr:uncharacterized protein LY79DRAFT_584479 [Colletotrichum navitas]KAK1569825.1 hypothetical protein LY79DRAFT_584479 [Colletotrichum navitas]
MRTDDPKGLAKHVNHVEPVHKILEYYGWRDEGEVGEEAWIPTWNSGGQFKAWISTNSKNSRQAAAHADAEPMLPETETVVVPVDGHQPRCRFIQGDDTPTDENPAVPERALASCAVPGMVTNDPFITRQTDRRRWNCHACPRLLVAVRSSLPTWLSTSASSASRFAFPASASLLRLHLVRGPPSSSTSFSPPPEYHDDEDVQIESRSQSFELCFHADFAGKPDPISLHLFSSSSSSPILSPSSIISDARSVVLYRYKPAPLLKTPPPPFYIHELPQLLNLTDAKDTKASSPSVLLLLFIPSADFLLIGLIVYYLLGFPSPYISSSPFSFGIAGHAPPSSTYLVRIEGTSIEPVNLHHELLPIESKNFSLSTQVPNVFADEGLPPLLGEFDRVAGYTCQDASVYMASRPVYAAAAAAAAAGNVSENLDADIRLLCYSVQIHIHNAIFPWSRLLNTDPNRSSNTNLLFTASLLSDATEAGANYRAIARA